MPNIVLDTSTLINFIDFSYRFDYSAIEKSPHLFERMFPVLEIVENVIEAFVLPYSMGNKTAFNLLTFIHKMLLNKS